MEWFITHQDVEWLLAGKVVKTPEDYAKYTSTTPGLNTALYTKDWKPPQRNQTLNPYPKTRISVRQLTYASRYSEPAVYRSQKVNCKLRGRRKLVEMSLP
jgi:hypothetical protein